ncbi:glycosyltransferase family 1 protein [Cyathus striatus]|nr:glycosyltransferase family 1 protein [Cyathus striatus]
MKKKAPPTAIHLSDDEEEPTDIGDNPKLPVRTDSLGRSLTNTSQTSYTSITTDGEGLSSIACLSPDGRIDISFDFKHAIPDLPKDWPAREVEEFAVDTSEWKSHPIPISIVIMIVGSRGDVQPYIALGKELYKDGHRIRIATHETFRGFVTDAGLEFFNIGGNPQDLMSYMVKNPGLMPGFESLTNGDIGKKRTMLEEIMNGCWSACYAPCPITGRAFAADAIISNPPAFAHVHCAEALGVPLLLSFTMPWSPTTAFPHPLVNIQKSNASSGITNYLSYAAADLLTWQGVGDIINKLRTKTLGLSALSIRSGPGLADRLKIPWTYCMSPALVPKPEDWKNNIDVVGFYFLDLASNYQPPDDLAQFLAAGDPPVYIGFGSVVIDDPQALTKTIFEATAQAGVRALVSAGWGGLGGMNVPSHVFILGNVPHDWLFANERVSAVVHHGGAGTTAIGLAMGRPTVIVPFFGDQGFWGEMIHQSKAGPKPIPPHLLNAIILRNAIKYATSPPAKEAARGLAEKIREENGVRSGVESFYKHLPLLNMRCDLFSRKIAVWWSAEHCLKLSALAAQVLIDAGEIQEKDLQLHRTKEYESRKEITDPVSGGAGAIFWTVTHYYASIAEIFISPVQGAVNTATAIPQGIKKIIYSVHEGFQNMPKLYGSNAAPRAAPQVTDFKSGLKEGGKSLFYGYYDGITNLVKEPLRGAKVGGFTGAIKGSARSFVNATVYPATGILGFVTYPLLGAWGGSGSLPKEPDNRRETRIFEGREILDFSTDIERAEILKKFRELKKTAKERRKRFVEASRS